MNKEKPNILFIFTDQHRVDTIGCYNSRVCKTPNIDRLSSEGITFTRAYSPCAVCSPTRASILTGQYPHTHKIITNIYTPGCGYDEIPNHPDLLSSSLYNAGYQLGYVGKWHLGQERLPRHLGFQGDNFPGHGNGGFGYPEYQLYLSKHGFKHDFLKEPKKIVSHKYGNLSGPEESTVPYFLAENTISLLNKFRENRKQNGTPFFIWTNFWGPHSPYFAPKKYVDMYLKTEIPPWSNFEDPHENKPLIHQEQIWPEARGKGWDFWKNAVAHYYSFVTLIDAQIGRILNELDTLGLAENTVVIFSADHGESLGMHGGMFNKPFSMYEELMRIPFIVRSPFTDRLKCGSQDNTLISLVDFAPTCLDLAGFPVPRKMEGKSLVHKIASNAPEYTHRKTLVSEGHGLWALTTQRMVREGSEKYVYNFGDIDEFYNLEDDPFELNNRICDPSCAKKISEMKEALLDWMKQTSDIAMGYFINRMKL